MSTYEDDHNLRSTVEPNTSNDRSRPHQTLSSIISSVLTGTSANTNGEQSVTSLTNNEPDFTSFTNALIILNSQEGSELALQLLDSIQSGDTKKGIDDHYLDSLDRVDIKHLGDDDDCPICTNRFKDDKYPLIVRLPCDSKKPHIFDMDCIGPWLKMNSTCPLCRFDLLDLAKKRKEKLDQELKDLRDEQSEEEEEGWDVYG